MSNPFDPFTRLKEAKYDTSASSFQIPEDSANQGSGAIGTAPQSGSTVPTPTSGQNMDRDLEAIRAEIAAAMSRPYSEFEKDFQEVVNPSSKTTALSAQTPVNSLQK